MQPESSPVGVLVLRVWSEPGDEMLRARITHTIDVASSFEVSKGARGAGGVLEVVNQFLLDFALTPRSGADAPVHEPHATDR